MSRFCSSTAAAAAAAAAAFAVQTCIRNLTGSWKIRRRGSAFPTPSKTSLEQFKRDPSTMRVELEPITDDTSNLEMHYSFQVGEPSQAV